MSAIQIFKECKATLDELAKAAANARSEVVQLLAVLEGPTEVTDEKPKTIEDDADAAAALIEKQRIDRYGD